MTSPSFRPLAAALLASLLAFFVCWRLAATGWPATADSVGQVSKYCERGRAGPLREPANALSNAGFVLAGLFVLFVGGHDRRAARPPRNPMIGLGPHPALFAAGLIFLGFGSGLYHASHEDWAGKLDDISMLMAMGFPLFYNLARLGRWGERKFVASFAAFSVLMAVLFVIDDSHSIAVANAVVLLGIGSEVLVHLPRSPVKRRRGPPYWIGFVAVCAAARTTWILSRAGEPLCAPDSLLQGHALWHLLCAAAVAFYYLDCRSEA